MMMEKELDQVYWRSITKEQWIGWLLERQTAFTHCLSLTMKQSIETYSADGYKVWLPLNQHTASSELAKFRDRLNRKTYGRAYKGRPIDDRQEVCCFAVLEGLNEEFSHIHYHISLGFPNREESDSVIDNRIRSLWNSTTLGKGITQIDFGEIRTYEGWTNYINKTRDETFSYVDVANIVQPK